MSTVDKAKYNQAMAWFEIYYILIASVFCILPMLADLLNAMTLVLRLPMTLDSPMPNEQVAKLESMATMAFMSTMVANMLPSLGSMDNNTLVQHVIAFPILTIMLNLDSCVKLHTGVIGQGCLACIQVAMLVFLHLILISAAITIPSIKKILESKYHSISQRFSNHQHPQDTPALEKLRQEEERYRMMAENANPELVVTSGMISLACLVIYIIVAVEILRKSGSEFRWCSLLATQSIGVVVGSIAPICRCIMAASFESSGRWNMKQYLAVFRVEDYWTQQLYEWKYSHITFPSRRRRSKKLIKNHILSLLIGFQIGFVVTCKIMNLIPILVVTCITYILFILFEVIE